VSLGRTKGKTLPGNFWNPGWNGDIAADVAVRRSVSGLAGKPRDEVADHAQGEPSERNLFVLKEN